MEGLMTAQLKRFPAQSRTAEQQALWIKYDRIGNRLQEITRKADLLSYAIGIMALEDNDVAWPMQELPTTFAAS
jgi:hypothetical protein